MFAHRVHMRVRSNCAAELADSSIKNLFQYCESWRGFQEEITFVTQGGTETFTISLWGSGRERRSLQPHYLPGGDETRFEVYRREPEVGNFDVTNSTFHKIVSVVSV